MTTKDIRIEEPVTATAYRFPTPEPEADGTLTWDATTAVVVTVDADGERGLGWSYTTAATAAVVEHDLAPVLHGRSPFDIEGCRTALIRACRNIGTGSVVAHALSAVDIALWDLQARLLRTSLSTLFDPVRPATPVYGSGGFTSLTDDQLTAQLADWRAAGCAAMKIKIGQDRGHTTSRDLQRTALAAGLVGDHAELMVDANGAYTIDQARRIGPALDNLGVTWFEEPVTSDNPHGLQEVRRTIRCEVTAGEYIYDRYDTAALVDSVDCLQLDVTRCGGYSGFRECAALARAHGLDVSAHCAPALHAPLAAAIPNLRHVEWFIDHARLEPLLVDGTPEITEGMLPARGTGAAATGHGMSLAESAAEYRLRPTNIR